MSGTDLALRCIAAGIGLTLAALIAYMVTRPRDESSEGCLPLLLGLGVLGCLAYALTGPEFTAWLYS